MKKYFFGAGIIIAVAVSVFSPRLSFSQETQAPANLEEARSFGLEILNKLPDAAIRVWKEQAIPILQSMWDRAKEPLNSLKEMFSGLLGKEIEKRKPDLKKEFQKEKEEIRSDLPQTIETGKSLWERFKELLE